MSTIDFFREGLKNLKTVGTVTRSSKFLCKNAVSHVDFSQAHVLVELGAGDGVITKYILSQMRHDAKLLAFEVNPKFCGMLRKIDDDRLLVIEDSAENLGQHLSAIGAEEVDDVFSAIPFVALPDELGVKIVQTCHHYLKNGGLYIQIHYSLLMRRLYDKIFGNVDINFVPLNVPPAFVLVSKKH